MCGRFNVSSGPLSDLLMELVGLMHPGPDNYNAAPTETVMVLRMSDAGEPELVPQRWWLTPHWAKEISSRYSMFNAKSETVESSRAFKEPFRKRRCVVPVSGFYEWARGNNRKLPYYLAPHDQPGMLLAGVWDRWRDKATSDAVESFAVLTCTANGQLTFVHHRQPVMLSMGDAHRWLSSAVDPGELKDLCASPVPTALDAVPVSSYVNNARNKESRCTDAIGPIVPIAADGGI